jgi:hypothetical protein
MDKYSISFVGIHFTLAVLKLGYLSLYWFVTGCVPLETNLPLVIDNMTGKFVVLRIIFSTAVHKNVVARMGI